MFPDRDVGVSGDAEAFLEDADTSASGTFLSVKFPCCFFQIRVPGSRLLALPEPVFSSRK